MLPPLTVQRKLPPEPLQQEAGLEGFKAETDRLKALMPDPSKMPKLTGEVNKCMISGIIYKSMAEDWRNQGFGFRLIKVWLLLVVRGEAAKGFRAVAAMFGEQTLSGNR